jgi:hypothetical protein
MQSNPMADNTGKEKNTFDLNVLQSRINQIKEEGNESSEFTLNFIKCLMYRHNLKFAIPEDFEIDDIPTSIIETIVSGEIPTIDSLNILSEDDKNWLIIQLIWVCGLAAIYNYCQDEEVVEDGESTFDVVLAMMDVSEAHCSGCYVLCALTLLMAKLPPLEMIELITNDFSNNPMSIERSKEVFYQLSSGIISRYMEDLVHYDRENIG